MHDNRNGGLPPLSTRGGAPLPPVDRVCGLGLCDVLRVEFERCQLASLHAELDELRRVFDGALEVAIAGGDEEDRDRLRYERTVLAAIDAQVLSGDGSRERAVAFGPAKLMGDVIAGATRNSVDALAEHLGRRSRGDATSGALLLDAAEEASAWIETHVAVQRLESYSFDPEFDHVRQW
jgi:hypothetical protein